MPVEPFDKDAAKIEAAMWLATGQLRWRRPRRGSDTDKVLEVLWERVTGEREWRPVGTFLED